MAATASSNGQKHEISQKESHIDEINEYLSHLYLIKEAVDDTLSSLRSFNPKIMNKKKILNIEMCILENMLNRKLYDLKKEENGKQRALKR
ncbi:hypothetical protein M153_9350002946 [Pseudoloma neurophilia]|uniref:Uncharacterized protein n=1 Tax=Pseudoloma neurophilia TaxID=146866 RepID=A0A0R0M190_9MICR|nr:hypothetical protein M153_9350002946 [Pseudoloma neurophilia]